MTLAQFAMIFWDDLAAPIVKTGVRLP
ncbi:type I toxin-antitoxin system toxin Ldr family protein [Escherichia coli]|nr:type I toxin-antitoxin system toxin Ldr family protein [Escherichia coli]